MMTDDRSEDGGRGGVAAVDRALTILSVFTERDASLSLAELAARTGLYKSTLLRLAESLGRFGFLERTPQGRYRIGPGAWRVGVLFLRHLDLGGRLQPLVDELAGVSEESVSFYVPVLAPAPGHRICLLRADSTHSLRDHIRIGDRLPFDAGAGGRMLRALLIPTGPADQAVAEAGYFLSFGDRTPEIGAVAAPVRDSDNRVAGALTLSAPTSRRDRDWFVQHIALVQDYARRATASLGGVPGRAGTPEPRR